MPAVAKLKLKRSLPFAALFCVAAIAGCINNPRTDRSNTSYKDPLPHLPQAPVPDPRFTALPKTAEVLAALPSGRIDPFAPPALAIDKSKNGKAPLKPPSLQFTGVALTNRGGPQAFVAFNSESGAVSPGDQGGAAIPWLPPGWRVISINVQQGQLVLGNGPQRFPFQL
ncbi:hypothetical protein KBY79_07620 [Synechococcus lacustris C3-12m-Tous]|uniref:hypothetical protein n=1 Tax=Synechococcus lacustris TaxID=2116544 RepID=UPI0020CDAED5|nr:hypothetical protein [Synechococcus lacustris]MCP9925081.1 hypothetical protein [Synechococcus lacustris C3-12m-Tous]